MIIRKNDCVGCVTDQKDCYNCKFNSVEVHYCDICECNEADFHISDWYYDDFDICEGCFEQYLNDMFANEFSVLDKADALGVTIQDTYK